MNLPTSRAALAVVALLVTAPAVMAAQAPGGRGAEPLAAELALVTFDSAWSRIHATHYDTAMRGVNWQAVRDSLRPRAASARTLGELRAVLSAMLATLGESHFGLIPQEVADGMAPDAAADAQAGAPGDAGLELRLVGNDVMVAAVRPGGPAARAGVTAGWIVDSVGRFGQGRLRKLLAGGAVPRQTLTAMLPGIARSQLAGNAGTTAMATFIDGTGRRIRKELRRDPLPGTPVRFGNLPTMFVEVQHEVRELPGGAGCAGVIRFNAWMLPAVAALDSAVDAVRHCRGIAVDIRGNPGGVGAMIMGFGGHFLDSAYALGVLRTRSNTLRFVANPRRTDTRHAAVAPFAGPLAIVVDSLSMSTSEIFAAGMQAVGRARVFGEGTPGLALPAVLTRLPTGDVLMHVFADFTDPDGRRIEGSGVVADVPVPRTRTALLAGRDEPLEAALAWIAGTGVTPER